MSVGRTANKEIYYGEIYHYFIHTLFVIQEKTQIYIDKCNVCMLIINILICIIL